MKKGTTKKIKQIFGYDGEVAVYELSRMMKKDRKNIKYVVAAKPKTGSGKPIVVIWASNQEGDQRDMDILLTARGKTVAEAFDILGYTLV